MGRKNWPPKLTHYWESILLESVAFVYMKRDCIAAPLCRNSCGHIKVLERQK